MTLRRIGDLARSMDSCDLIYQALLTSIDDNGHRPVGPGREVDIVSGPDGPEVTEIQIPIETREQ